MKSFYEKYQNASEETKDALLNRAVNKMLDKQLQSEIEVGLSADQPISITKKEPFARRRWLRIVIAAAASIAVLIVAYINLSDTGDITVLTSKYLSEDLPTHPGVEKGAGEQATKIRNDAIKAFNDQNYTLSGNLFKQISKKGEEDNYYLALSSLYAGQYSEAIQVLQKNLQNPNSKYVQEMNWYLASAFILNDNKEQATQQLEQINPGNWNYDKAQKLLRKLSKQ